MLDDTCGKKERKPMTKPCAKCGVPVEYNMEGMTRPFCEKCMSQKKKTLKNRKYYREHPEKNKKCQEQTRTKTKIARESGKLYPSDALMPFYKENYTSTKRGILYDEPCFFCEFGCCGGTRKVYVTISGKSIFEELNLDRSSCGVTHIPKENIPELLDRDRFIVCCVRHASQIVALRRYHEEWEFDDVIEEVIHRCK